MLDDVTAMLEAAIQGAGVMLSLPSLLQEEFQSGRLVAPFEGEVEPELAYYVVYLPGALGHPEVRAFRDFLFEERDRADDTGWPRRPA